MKKNADYDITEWDNIRKSESYSDFEWSMHLHITRTCTNPGFFTVYLGTYPIITGRWKGFDQNLTDMIDTIVYKPSLVVVDEESCVFIINKIIQANHKRVMRIMANSTGVTLDDEQIDSWPTQ